MKATEQYFPVVLFIMLYKVVLGFEFVDEIQKCDHSNESNWAVRSYGVFIMLYKVVLTFCVTTIPIIAVEKHFLPSNILQIRCSNLEFLSVILKCDYSN